MHTNNCTLLAMTALLILCLMQSGTSCLLAQLCLSIDESLVLPEWFGSTCDVFALIPNTPDIVFVDTSHREVLMLEVGCVFDLYMDQAFQDKYVKYQPLLETITSLGYTCRYSVLILGSLGHVHKCTTRGLQIAGLSRSRAKQIAKYGSVSAIIGSLAVWRRRCYVYP